MKLAELVWLILIGSHQGTIAILHPNIFAAIDKANPADGLHPLHIKNITMELYHARNVN